MSPDAWKPEQYARFAAERRQPFDDLLALVVPIPRGRAVDLGCGAGELTRVLHEHTRAAETLGIDSSEAVLVKMVDFSAMTGKFWFFHTGLTNLEYTLTVTDSVTGAVKTYEGRGDFCAGADVHAFAD